MWQTRNKRSKKGGVSNKRKEKEIKKKKKETKERDREGEERGCAETLRLFQLDMQLDNLAVLAGNLFRSLLQTRILHSAPQSRVGAAPLARQRPHANRAQAPHPKERHERGPRTAAERRDGRENAMTRREGGRTRERDKEKRRKGKKKKKKKKKKEKKKTDRRGGSAVLARCLCRESTYGVPLDRIW